MIRKDRIVHNKSSEAVVAVSDGLYIVTSDPWTAEVISVFASDVHGSEFVIEKPDKVVNIDVISQ